MASKQELTRLAVSVECVILGWDGSRMNALLTRRQHEPFADWWALPAERVRIDETLDNAASRILLDVAGTVPSYQEQLYTLGDLDRHPSERVVSVAYLMLVPMTSSPPWANSGAVPTAWHSLDDPPKLAFDHDRILDLARQRLRAKLRYQPVGFALLDAKFTLTELQHLYEQVLGRSLDKRNFRKKLLGMGLLAELKERETGVAHRAAQLFRFDKQRYRRMLARGLQFEI